MSRPLPLSSAPPLLLLILTPLLAVAACGGGSPSGHKASSLEADLTVEVSPSEGAATLSATLRCAESPAATGFIADAAAACAAVAAHRDLLLAPPPRDRVCTQIYGGSQVATVRGELDGRAVDRRFGRRDGCEIADWDALAPLLGRH